MTEAATSNKRGKRTENREVRRQQLVEATIASIAELGFSNTTLASVTKRAGLSHGTINFHFKSKEMLFAETLGYLAQEHYDHWSAALENAGPDPAKRLAAIIEVDFKPQICSPEKLAVWFSFWGQARYRPAYLEGCDRYDLERFAAIEALCEEIIREGGYGNIDALSATRRIESLIDGLWLNILLYPKKIPRERAREDVLNSLAQLFPRHFPQSSARSFGTAPTVKTIAQKG